MGACYTIEVTNLVDPGPPVSYSVKVVDGENLYKGMCGLEADPSSGFTFKSKLTSFGHFITKINGLEQDESRQNYWMIYIDDLEHLAPVGVDGLYPKRGDKYIFAYKHYDGDHCNKVKE